MYYYRLKPSKIEYDKDIKRRIYSYMVNIDGEKEIELYVGESVTKRIDPLMKRFDRANKKYNNKHESVRYIQSGQDSQALTPHSQHHNSN